MTDPALHIVSAISLYDDAKGKKLMAARRKQLLESAVKHVREGTQSTRAERLREASELTGIPLNLIEVELSR